MCNDWKVEKVIEGKEECICRRRDKSVKYVWKEVSIRSFWIRYCNMYIIGESMFRGKD